MGRTLLGGLRKLTGRGAHRRDQQHLGQDEYYYYSQEDEHQVPGGGVVRHQRGQAHYGQQEGELIFEDELFGFRTRVRLVDRQVLVLGICTALRSGIYYNHIPRKAKRKRDQNILSHSTHSLSSTKVEL